MTEGVDAGGLQYCPKELANGEKTQGCLAWTNLDARNTYEGDATFGRVANLINKKSPSPPR